MLYEKPEDGIHTRVNLYNIQKEILISGKVDIHLFPLAR